MITVSLRKIHRAMSEAKIYKKQEVSEDYVAEPMAMEYSTVAEDGKRIRDAAFFLIIMLFTFAATLLKSQKYVSSRTIQKCVEHVSTST